jgi:hypothetical protein
MAVDEEEGVKLVYKDISVYARNGSVSRPVVTAF